MDDRGELIELTRGDYADLRRSFFFMGVEVGDVAGFVAAII